MAPFSMGFLTVFLSFFSLVLAYLGFSAEPKWPLVSVDL